MLSKHEKRFIIGGFISVLFGSLLVLGGCSEEKFNPEIHTCVNEMNQTKCMNALKECIDYAMEEEPGTVYCDYDCSYYCFNWIEK